MSKYFTTSDGQEFYQENAARNHAKTLEDKTVTAPSDEAIAEMEVVGAKVETGEDLTDEGLTDEAPKDEAPKEINLSKMTKAQLVDFATDNELIIDAAATNAAIIESIEVQLTEKNQA